MSEGVHDPPPDPAWPPPGVPRAGYLTVDQERERTELRYANTAPALAKRIREETGQGLRAGDTWRMTLTRDQILTHDFGQALEQRRNGDDRA